MDINETWMPTTAVAGYEVSDLGRVRHAAKGTIKGAPTNASGYRVVSLWHRNVGRTCYVHDLVAAAFLGPKPAGISVNHIDGDKLNNLPSNLEYISLAENSRHQARTGLGQRGEGNGHAKLTEDQVKSIRARSRSGERTSDLAREFGVGQPIISQIKGGTRWGHLSA